MRLKTANLRHPVDKSKAPIAARLLQNSLYLIYLEYSEFRWNRQKMVIFLEQHDLLPLIISPKFSNFLLSEKPFFPYINFIQSYLSLLYKFRCFMRSSNSSYPEVVVQKCSVKKVFLEISQNSHENSRAVPCFFFNKVAGLQLY